MDPGHTTDEYVKIEKPALENISKSTLESTYRLKYRTTTKTNISKILLYLLFTIYHLYCLLTRNLIPNTL